MPVQLLNHTTTNSYEDTKIGLESGVYAFGTLIVTTNPVSVLFFHGGIGGQMAPYEYLSLLPGTYPLFSGERDKIGGLKIKSAVAGQAAVVSAVLYEPGQAGLAPSAVINPLA